jgi:uncharacterized damage-inducible protein DinB
MESTAVSTLASVTTMFEMQTRLFTNATDGISDENATERLNETNHIAWLTGHIVSTRIMLLNVLGNQMTYSFDDLFGKGKGLEADANYPSMADLMATWNEVSENMMAALNELDEDRLNSEAPFQVPISDPSLRGLLTFFVHHEAYHLGQIGLLRKGLGYEAMGYK